MDSSPNQKTALQGIRQEIDSIDEQIVDLLCARFSASDKVRAAKASGPEPVAMPYRPGREAIIMRRLLERAADRLPAGVIERVWRAIISASVMAQANVRVVTIAEVLNDARYRAAVDAFASMVPVEKVSSLKAALETLSSGEPVLVVVPMKLDWRNSVARPTQTGVVRVVSVLAAGSEKPSRSLVVLGQAVSEPTGEDETLLITAGKLPRDFVPKPVWHLKIADDCHLTALPGYLRTSEQPLVGLKVNTGLSLRIAGRYPSPVEMVE